MSALQGEDWRLEGGEGGSRVMQRNEINKMKWREEDINICLYLYTYLYINISDYFYKRHTTIILEALAEPNTGVEVLIGMCHLCHFISSWKMGGKGHKYCDLLDWKLSFEKQIIIDNLWTSSDNVIHMSFVWLWTAVYNHWLNSWLEKCVCGSKNHI
jgi:hypothetical protein